MVLWTGKTEISQNRRSFCAENFEGFSSKRHKKRRKSDFGSKLVSLKWPTGHVEHKFDKSAGINSVENWQKEDIIFFSKKVLFLKFIHLDM